MKKDPDTLTTAEFIVLWQKSKTVADVCATANISRQEAHRRAGLVRRHIEQLGATLKKHELEDWEAMAALAKMHAPEAGILQGDK